MTQIESNTGKIRADIQALRALAVVAVVICHMNPAWLPGGYLGVDIFFVISGFVITQLLLEKQEKPHLWHFWVQRFFRIVPAYVVMLAVVAGCAALFFLPENFSQFAKSWRQSLYFVSNQYFAGYGDYFSPALTEQPLLHTWSLSVEMQFYLLYPIFLLVLMRLQLPWLLLIAAVAGFGIAQWSWLHSSAPNSLYYGLYIRVPEFLAGSALAAHTNKINTPWTRKQAPRMAGVGMLLMLGALYFVDEQSFSPFMAGIVCLGAVLVMAARLNEGWLASAFRLKSILFLGALSYSIYLWHWPLLAFMRYVYGDLQWRFLLMASYSIATLSISWLSWKFIENKFRWKLDQRLGTLAKKMLAVICIALSPVAYAKQLNMSVPALPIEFTRYADDSAICHSKILSNCIRGMGSPPQWLLIGDSHAAQLNLAADIAGKSLGIGIEVLTASSCVPLAGFNIKKLPEWAQKPCEQQIELVSQKIGSAKNIILAGMWSYQFQDEAFQKVLKNFLHTSTAQGKHVLILAQIPKLTSNPRRLSRLHYWGLDLTAEINTDWRAANVQLEKIISEYPLAQYFEPSGSEMFFTPPFYKNVFIYHDQHHLNERGAQQYGNLLVALLKNSYPN